MALLKEAQGIVFFFFGPHRVQTNNDEYMHTHIHIHQVDPLEQLDVFRVTQLKSSVL